MIRSRGVCAHCTEIVTAGQMAFLEKAGTRCMSGEVQYYNKEMYTWNMEEEWSEKERQRRSKRERGRKWLKKGRWFVKEEW